ncbi:MAG: FAD-dependent oxidoreductase [Clostridiales bacterium 43-6]|nr:MAG: FAD-dependent oxidoreductase [Clostridiales bacterium 43-6]
MAAGVAAKNGNDVTVIERNERPARKLMITGKGRCNITNHAELDTLIKSTPGNGRFLYSAFSRFSPTDLIKLLEDLGLPLKVERGNRVFPVSDKAVDAVDALVKHARQNGAKLLHGRAEKLVIEKEAITAVLLEDGGSIPCDRVIVATGGLSYPGTGSTGDGYILAQQAGHTIRDTRASLVPLNVHEGFVTELMGLSLKNISIQVIDTKKNKEIYQDFGELLFTHFGLSGPVILSASAHMREPEEGRYKIMIDLKPALDYNQLDGRLMKDFEKNLNRDFINALDELLPRKLIPVIIRLSRIPPHTKVNQITKEQRTGLCVLLKALTFHITSTRSVEEAVITAGGVNIKEIDPKTMGSKVIGNLFFAGEVMDVDAYTGGFNLQIAFSTGFVAGNSV